MKKIIYVLVFVSLITGKNVYALDVSASNACLIERITGQVLFEKNMNEKAAMASTTKIMTAITALENSNTDSVVTVSRNASVQEGSSAYLRDGDKILMEDLLYGLMLNSGNDAAVAVAEHVSGDTESFADLMNKKAYELEAKNTNFVNPNGLYDEKHYTTAYDLAKISAYAMQNPKFRDIVSSKTKAVTVQNTGAKMYFSNHNKMLKLYDGASGVKTGFTKKSGRCLVSSAERDGIELIAVTLNAPDDWNDHKNMLDFGFTKVNLKTILKKGDILDEKIAGESIVKILCGEDVKVPYFGNNRDYTVVTHIAENLYPPLNTGEKIGICDIVYDGRTIKQIDLISDSEIYKKTSFFERIMDFFVSGKKGRRINH